MMYGYQEIKNAVIIKGKLYGAVFKKNFGCHDCELRRRFPRCLRVCLYFKGRNDNVVFRRIKGNLLLKLHENEEG